jgi:hypothetical protein
MIQAFSHIFNFFNIASPCGDMDIFFLQYNVAIWVKFHIIRVKFSK